MTGCQPRLEVQRTAADPYALRTCIRWYPGESRSVVGERGRRGCWVDDRPEVSVAVRCCPLRTKRMFSIFLSYVRLCSRYDQKHSTPACDAARSISADRVETTIGASRINETANSFGCEEVHRRQRRDGTHRRDQVTRMNHLYRVGEVFEQPVHVRSSLIGQRCELPGERRRGSRRAGGRRRRSRMKVRVRRCDLGDRGV